MYRYCSIFTYYFLHSLGKIRMKCRKDVSDNKLYSFYVQFHLQTLLVSISRFYDWRVGNFEKNKTRQVTL